MTNQLYVYHSNDLHSHFEHWPQIASYFKSMKRAQNEAGNGVLFFDIGDHMDRSNLISEATLGQGNVSLLNDVAYDGVTIGNNEGITLSKEELDNLYNDANFNVLVANLFYADGSRPKWAKPYVIKKMANGMTIAAIGVTVPYYLFYEQLGWRVKDPFEVLPTLIDHIKKEADAVILLSHLGINEDERMANELSGIDVILGGHTHHLLPEGKEINGTMLAAGGKFGMYVGEVVLTVDEATKQIISKKASVVSVDDLEECMETKTKIKKLSQESEQLLQERVTELKEGLSLSWFHPSPLAQVLSDGLREWCDAEISMINAGILLDELPKGLVTRKDLHRICPHPVNPCKVVVTGAQLKEIIHQAFTEEMQRLELKGLGFRGKLLGRMVFTGVNVTTEDLSDGLSHVRQIEVLGRPIDPKRKYVIATLDMFTFGFLYPEFKHAKEKHYYLPEMLRDVLGWTLMRL